MKVTRNRAKSVFLAAVENCPPERWDDFLVEACEGDADLRRRVRVLLDAHQGADSLLDQPEPAATVAVAYPLAEGPGTTIGPYKLLEPIGEGGMGVVFMAEQTHPVRRRVALKVIKPGMDTRQVVARFEAERQALALMDHPNIARVLDAGATESGRPYFVMELVRGVPITDYCDREKLPLKDRLDLFVQVCRAVQHAHQKGVIHRDIKPSNVLVTLHDGVPVPKVIDFGIAKATGGPLTDKTLFTAFAQLVGTPLYMSPEQAELSGLDVDTRSDIYSLGVLLYELLTGTTPFDAEALRRAAFDEMRRIIREVQPPTPSTRLVALEATSSTVSADRGSDPRRLGQLMRGELDWIVMKALEKDRTRRYETANDLSRDLRRYLDGDPVEAGPPSAAYRLRRYARKHRTALAMAAAITAVLLAATAVTTRQAVLARHAAAAARRERAAAVSAGARAIRERDAAAIARRRAESAEGATRRELARSELMNRFLTEDLLGQAEPAHNAVEEKITLLEVLDRAAEKVGPRFAGRPELEGELRRVIARAYHGLGSWEKAERQYRAARDSAARRLGPDSAEALRDASQLAHLLRHRGRLGEAIDLGRSALDGLARVLGAGHPDTLTGRGNLASIYRDAGRTVEAIGQHEETLRRQEARLGSDHPDTLTSRGNLAAAYLDAGRTAEAIGLLEETLRRQGAKLGPDHPGTLTSRSNLATAYLIAGRTAEAIALEREALARRSAKLGPDHPDTLASRGNLAAAYLDAGRTAEAIGLLEETLRRPGAKLGPDHPDTLTGRGNLAVAYLRTGRTAESIALLEKTLAVQEARLGPDHPDTLASRGNLAIAYGKGGRTAESLALMEEVLPRVEARLGPDHPHTLAVRDNLASAYRDAGRWDRAEPLLRDLLARQRARTSPDGAALAAALAQLARALLHERKWHEAETALRECLTILEARSPDAWPRFGVMSLLGGALLGQGRYAEAEPLIVGGYQGLRARGAQIPPANRSDLRQAGQRVVALYEAWGRPGSSAAGRAETGRAPTELPADVFARP